MPDWVIAMSGNGGNGVGLQLSVAAHVYNGRCGGVDIAALVNMQDDMWAHAVNTNNSQWHKRK